MVASAFCFGDSFHQQRGIPYKLPMVEEQVWDLQDSKMYVTVIAIMEGFILKEVVN